MSCKCNECKCGKSELPPDQVNSTIISDEIISETPNDAELGGRVREFYISKKNKNV